MDLAARSFKRPATVALGTLADGLQWSEETPPEEPEACGYREIRYEERGPVGYLHFDFYNGALCTAQMRAAARRLRRGPCDGRRESSC